MFVGSYAEATGPGLYVCQFDEQSGQLSIASEIEGLVNPTFLTIDAKQQRVYAIAAQSEADQTVGVIVAYQYDAEQQALREINREKSTEATTCHIEIDQTEQFLITSSYHGGMVSLSPILENGKVGKTLQVHQHEGSSINPAQTQARAHSAIIDATNRFVVVSDLGADKIVVYKLVHDEQQLVYNSEVKAEPGAGPRHFTFHPSLPYAYVINELNASITAYAFDQDQGELTFIETVPTLPPTYSGDNACADIHISSDGRFLYGSNRGHDSIVVYEIDQTNGHLRLIEHVSTEGEHPRNFTLSPDNRFVLVANRDTNNIVTFSRDAQTGLLQHTGTSLELSRPVCLKFM